MIKKKYEFSKLILMAVMGTYFIGLIFGIIVIWKMLSNNTITPGYDLGALFGFIGTPVSVAIAFYSYKAKNENVEKIRRVNKETDGDAPTDI